MTSDSPIKRVGLCTLCVSLLALSGCGVFGSSCEAPPPPEDTVTLPALHAPPGVPAPDTRNALRIPELAEPERPRRKSDPCLEEPPVYSPGWRPDEAGATPDTAAATGDAPTTQVSKESKKKKKKRTEQVQ